MKVIPIQQFIRQLYFCYKWTNFRIITQKTYITPVYELVSGVYGLFSKDYSGIFNEMIPYLANPIQVDLNKHLEK